MKRILSLPAFLLVIQLAAQDLKLADKVDMPAHPRILLLAGEEKNILAGLHQDTTWLKMHKTILNESDQMIALPLLERIQIGKRLLDKSREAIRRIFYLSYAWRMTGEQKYFQRAEREMINIAGFSDWNPTHFLDVAEMTMALAIGYDWLFSELPETSKQTIRDAILKKGIEPSLDEKYNWFLTANHNWNQVCNAGMTYGALAIWEQDPALSKKIIERALNTIRLPMAEYKPDGAYPEGYGYWDYGTSFNIMFITAIEKVFGSDFNLTATPGFLNTANFHLHMTGTTGLAFNWGDSGLQGNLTPAMFWFAHAKKDPSVLWVQKQYLKEKYSRFTRNRLLPAIMIWKKDLLVKDIKEPSSKVWMGQGANPVCLMRTSWTDPNAIYVGFKAGAASVNHAHMDIGSFVMEADGVRWACDFGPQDYESLESKGIRLFGRTQDAQRWSVFRLNNFVHNTLTINNQLQLVKGYAKIDRHSANPKFPFAIADITSVYESEIAKAERGVGIVNGETVVVRDELVARDKPARIRWTMLTSARVTIANDSVATLEQNEKKLYVLVKSSQPCTLQTWSTAPATDYDAPNPGTTLVGFETQIAPGQSANISVLLVPGNFITAPQPGIKPLVHWK